MTWTENDMGKVVLITGASGGLGTAVVRAFLDADATVVGVSRSVPAGEPERPRFHPVTGDVSNAAKAAELAGAVESQHGPIGAVVHLVGGFAGGVALHDADGETLGRMFDLNVSSAFHVFRAALPAMRSRRDGCLLAIGSRAAAEPSPMAGAYAASKAALVSLVRTIAAENRDVAISANIVLPGTMDTPQNRAANPGADFAKWVSPDAVAKLLVHLWMNRTVTGAVIPVYGGEV